MFITEETHTIYFSNPAMESGWIEVQILWCDGGDAIIPNKPYDGEFWIEFKKEDGYLYGFTKPFYSLCTPSARHEVERAFRAFLRCCSIHVGSVIKESHTFYITADEEEYTVDFMGIPGHGRVTCSVETGGQSANLGMLGIDIKDENELLKYVYSKFNCIK